jgi:hypothetical protein
LWSLIGTRPLSLQVFRSFIEEGVLPGVPDAPNPPNFGRVSSYGCSPTCKNSKQTNPKDAQKHFGQLMEKIKTCSGKNSK